MTTHPLTIWLDDEPFAAISAQARRYQRTPDDHLAVLVQDALAAAVAEHRETQWRTRRARIEANPALAAQVDAGRP